MMRAPGWEQRLHALIDQRRSVPFAWGRADCCQLVLDALQALRGERPQVRPYRSERGALRVLERLGGLPQAAAALVGGEIPPGHAQRGDVVLIPAPASHFRRALAVCAGGYAYAQGADGLVQIPRSHWLRAWRA
jgi:hypothetical protein